MGNRLFISMALALVSTINTVCAQPGPLTAFKNNNLFLPASTLLTNGLPGLSGPPVNLMVATVQSNSAQGGVASLQTSLQWARRYNGTQNNEDQAVAIKTDKDGNIIVGGYSVGLLTGYDYLTIKYAPDGTALWTNRYDSGNSNTDQINSLAVDPSGAVYVSGDAGGAVVTIKYASDGTPIWTNQYTSSGSFLTCGGIAADANGNAYLLPVDDSNYYIAVKYDTAGNAVWTNLFRANSSTSEQPSAIAVDPSGNVFITGTSFDSTGSKCETVKYDSSGALIWFDRFSIVSLESGTRVILDQQNNVVVVGDSQGGTAQHQYFVIKYSNGGSMFWTNVVAAVNYVGGGVPDISTDIAGNVFLVGGTPGATTADFTSVKFSSAGVPVWTNRFVDPNAGTQEMNGTGTDNAGNFYYTIASASPGGANYNYVTVKYASNGVPVWTNRYDGPAAGSDLPRAMTVDKAGGVYVTGTSSSGGTSFSALDYATVKYADKLKYVPPANFVGQDTITFTAFDSSGNSATGTLTINVVSGPNVAVAPATYATIAGNGSLNTLLRNTNSPRTYQMQFTPTALGSVPVGARITELRFRLATNATVGYPSNAVTWTNYQITLAQAANNISSISTTFAANLLNPVLVKSGPLSIAPNSFTAGDNPNALTALAVLDTPYVYQGGDLVMEFTHPGSGSIEAAFLDAASTTSPGYGTSFRALSANAYAATTGAAASVTIVGIVFTPTVTQTISGTGAQLVITGNGGIAGAPYQILTSTDIQLPAAQWTPVVTNQFGASGGFTNLLQPIGPAQFFRILLP